MKKMHVLLTIASQLIEHKQTLTVAESCTGGMLAAALTSITGSSQWFNQSWITYSNHSKSQQLQVNPTDLQNYGAVSSQVACQMAKGALCQAKADWAVATTGIAGPGGGSADKPIGTVWFGFANNANKDGFAEVKYFEGDREQVRQQALDYALTRLAEMMLH